MQERELNRATIRVVNRTDIRGRGTADEMNRGLRTGKRLARMGGLVAFIAAGLLVAVAPLPARADDDKDRHRRHEDNDKGIRAEIAALQAQVTALQDQVNKLQTANTDQQDEIDRLQTQLTAVQSNHALLLGPFVSVDPDPEIGVIGPNIIFSGANIHIVSGSGSTDDGMLNNPSATLRGLGNLIIGYNEDPGKRPGGPEAPLPFSDLAIAVGRTTWSSDAGIGLPKRPLVVSLLGRLISLVMREPASAVALAIPPVASTPASSAASSIPPVATRPASSAVGTSLQTTISRSLRSRPSRDSDSCDLAQGWLRSRARF
jgi:hypothetical protein